MKEVRIIPKHLREPTLARLMAFLKTYLHEESALKVTIQRYQKDRSTAQNSMLWGLAYPPIMEHIGLRGEQDRQELHRHFCGMYFGWVEHPFLGRRPRRTTTIDEDGNRDVISTVVLNDMFEFIRQKAVELFGIVIPDPDPEWKKRVLEEENA